MHVHMFNDELIHGRAAGGEYIEEQGYLQATASCGFCRAGGGSALARAG